MPRADLLCPTRRRPRTDRRQEARPRAAVARLGAAGPEREAQQRKRYPGVIRAPTAIPAIHHAGFFRMQLEPAFLQPPLDRCQQSPRLAFAPAMHDCIISISSEGIL